MFRRKWTAILAAALACAAGGACVEERGGGGSGTFENREELELAVTAYAKHALCRGILSHDGLQLFLQYLDAPPDQWDPEPVLTCMALADSCESLRACYQCDVENQGAWCEGDDAVYCYAGVEVRESCAAFGASCRTMTEPPDVVYCGLPCDTAGYYCDDTRAMHCDGEEAGLVSECTQFQNGRCAVHPGGEPRTYCYSSPETPCGNDFVYHCEDGVLVGCSLGGYVRREDCSLNTFSKWCAADASGNAYCTPPETSRCSSTYGCQGTTFSVCLGGFDVVVDCADYDTVCTDDIYFGPYCGTLPSP